MHTQARTKDRGDRRNGRRRATISDLYDVRGKAELVKGRLVMMSPTGGIPGNAGFEIAASLRQHARDTGQGRAVPDNVGFRVDLPHRESFSPDAAFVVGVEPSMKFYEGAPIFAAEVRSEGDYGGAARKEMAAKRTDYFSCGTQVVWDVDPVGEDVVRVFRASDPDHPKIYRRGETAEAEPAVPGWTMLVDDLFL